MIGSGRLLALITARGGSQRLPRKNVLNLGGRPMIARSIEAGLQSKFIDRVVVTTDDDEIAQIARQYGADIPFMRPHELSSDTATSMDAIHHAISTLEDNGDQYEYLILLQPTSPLRTAKHIDEAVELLTEKNASGVVSVCEIEHPIEWTNTLPENHSMDGFLSDDVKDMRSQDFDKRYRVNGAIYLGRLTSVVQQNSMFLKDNSYAYIMKADESIDVDTMSDFQLVSLLV